jgi:hypothetical protein
VLQSLQATADPELASRVSATLRQAQQFRQMTQAGAAGSGWSCCTGRILGPQPVRGMRAKPLLSRRRGANKLQCYEIHSRYAQQCGLLAAAACHPDCGFRS